MVDEVGADGVVNAEFEGDLELGADAVGAGDQDGLLGICRVEREEAAEAADFAEDVAVEGALRASILMRCLARSPEEMSTPASA